MQELINFIPINIDAAVDDARYVAPRTPRMFTHYDRLYVYQSFNGVPFVPPKRKMNVVTHRDKERVHNVGNGPKMPPHLRGALIGNNVQMQMRDRVKQVTVATCICGTKCISVSGCVDTCRMSVP